MSAMVKARPRAKVPKKARTAIQDTEFVEDGRMMDPLAVIPDGEPPEEAIIDEEGPESWEEWSVEAPDAGRGGSPSIEREFTHGRSRS